MKNQTAKSTRFKALLFSAFCLSMQISLLAESGPAIPPKPTGDIPEGFNLIYEQDFENRSALNDFVFANPDNWDITKHEGNNVLEFSGKSKYAPAVTSPLNIALIAHRQVGDFVLECKMMQTGIAYNHRDMCLFFNFQEPDQYYYSHIATATEPRAHNIIIVDRKDRIKISLSTTQGVDWGQNVWRRVRIERDSKAGTIKVYYDDMTTPIMTASDTTFKAGWVGFGSFDDTGRIDDIKLWAPGKVKARRPTWFPSKPN